MHLAKFRRALQRKFQTNADTGDRPQSSSSVFAYDMGGGTIRSYGPEIDRKLRKYLACDLQLQTTYVDQNDAFRSVRKEQSLSEQCPGSESGAFFDFDILVTDNDDLLTLEKILEIVKTTVLPVMRNVRVAADGSPMYVSGTPSFAICTSVNRDGHFETQKKTRHYCPNVVDGGGRTCGAILSPYDKRQGDSTLTCAKCKLLWIRNESKGGYYRTPFRLLQQSTSTSVRLMNAHWSRVEDFSGGLIAKREESKMSFHVRALRDPRYLPSEDFVNTVVKDCIENAKSEGYRSLLKVYDAIERRLIDRSTPVATLTESDRADLLDAVRELAVTHHDTLLPRNCAGSASEWNDYLDPNLIKNPSLRIIGHRKLERCVCGSTCSKCFRGKVPSTRLPYSVSHVLDVDGNEFDAHRDLLNTDFCQAVRQLSIRPSDTRGVRVIVPGSTSKVRYDERVRRGKRTIAFNKSADDPYRSDLRNFVNRSNDYTARRQQALELIYPIGHTTRNMKMQRIIEKYVRAFAPVINMASGEIVRDPYANLKVVKILRNKNRTKLFVKVKGPNDTLCSIPMSGPRRHRSSEIKFELYYSKKRSGTPGVYLTQRCWCKKEENACIHQWDPSYVGKRIRLSDDDAGVLFPQSRDLMSVRKRAKRVYRRPLGNDDEDDSDAQLSREMRKLLDLTECLASVAKNLVGGEEEEEEEEGRNRIVSNDDAARYKELRKKALRAHKREQQRSRRREILRRKKTTSPSSANSNNLISLIRSLFASNEAIEGG